MVETFIFVLWYEKYSVVCTVLVWWWFMMTVLSMKLLLKLLSTCVLIKVAKHNMRCCFDYGTLSIWIAFPYIYEPTDFVQNEYQGSSRDYIIVTNAWVSNN